MRFRGLEKRREGLSSQHSLLKSDASVSYCGDSVIILVFLDLKAAVKSEL